MMFHAIEREALTASLKCLAIIAVVATSAFVDGLDAAPAGVRQTTSGPRMYVQLRDAQRPQSGDVQPDARPGRVGRHGRSMFSHRASARFASLGNGLERCAIQHAGRLRPPPRHRRDGAVIVKSTPGHTPGHQSLFVKLPRTGPVVLSGDLYHFPAERTFGKMPSGEAERGQTAVSRQRLEEFIKINKAQLWIQHDMVGYRKIKLAPEYYE